MSKKKLSWIPNTLTFGNLSMGFLVILISSSVDSGDKGASSYILAGTLLICASFLDGLDGTIARKLNSTSAIGADLDSLADLTTFGIAPAFLVYKIFLYDIKYSFLGVVIPLGMLVSVLLPICTAYRLARFNVYGKKTNSFAGLPSPIAGISVGFIPLLFANFDNLMLKNFVIFGFILISFLMVSNIQYSKPKLELNNKFSLIRHILAFFGLILISFILGEKWAWVFFVPLLLYIFSGIISFIIHKIQSFRIKV